MSKKLSRRGFLKAIGGTALALGLGAGGDQESEDVQPPEVEGIDPLTGMPTNTVTRTVEHRHEYVPGKGKGYGIASASAFAVGRSASGSTVLGGTLGSEWNNDYKG